MSWEFFSWFVLFIIEKLYGEPSKRSHEIRFCGKESLCNDYYQSFQLLRKPWNNTTLCSFKAVLKKARDDTRKKVLMAGSKVKEWGQAVGFESSNYARQAHKRSLRSVNRWRENYSVCATPVWWDRIRRELIHLIQTLSVLFYCLFVSYCLYVACGLCESSFTSERPLLNLWLPIFC